MGSKRIVTVDESRQIGGTLAIDRAKVDLNKFWRGLVGLWRLQSIGRIVKKDRSSMAR